MNPSSGERTRIGPYRLLRMIGRGGMAEVHLGVAVGASGFEKPIALKILRAEHTGDATLEKLLIEEAKLGAQLVHRNLVQVHELGVDEGAYYVRMDFIDGGDLASRLKRGAMPEELALLVAEEVVEALAYVHAHGTLGLVHRDVSATNVLISRLGEVKLADFGLAKATRLADVTQANVRKGTYAYMSPEQVAGAALSAASDQFSFASLLYEMLAGRRIFDGATPHETMQNIVAAQVGELPEIARDLAAMLRRCFAREPSARFPDADALRLELNRARRARPEVGMRDLAAWFFTM